MAHNSSTWKCRKRTEHSLRKTFLNYLKGAGSALFSYEELDILNHLQTFAGDIMPTFYGIKDKLPHREIILEKKPLLVAPEYDGIVTPIPGETLPWNFSVMN